jgi:hypothetical protein
MFARLSTGFGWTCVDDKGIRGPIVLAGVQRYAGMVSGKAVHDGRPWARPLAEFDALSNDGIEWKPFFELRSLIPWENYVQDQELPLPGVGESSN